MKDSSENSPPSVQYSVLVSCYFEERSVEEFHARLSATLQASGRRCEMIFVNDGSTDGTFEKLQAIFDADPDVTAVFDLFGNVGQPNAKTVGVLCARGRAIVQIDSDLQLDPEELPVLMAKYEEGYDIVSGYRRERRDPISRRLPSILANGLMRAASGSKIRDYGCTFKIYDGRLVRGFDFDRFRPWRALPVITAAGRVAEVPVNHHDRKYGKSGWTFRKLFTHNMESMVNLSAHPFQMLAAACVAFALVFATRIALSWLLRFSILTTVTNGLILNALVVGFLAVLAVLAVIGEFVIRNFSVLQRRPAFVIRDFRMRRPRTPELMRALGLTDAEIDGDGRTARHA
jgi:glycosyltransferase involved in cell wall biosynthesis